MTTGNVIIRPKPQDLSITMKQVARYAGGSRYRMDADMEKKTALVLEEAVKSYSPHLYIPLMKYPNCIMKFAPDFFCLKTQKKFRKSLHAFAH
jgi:hypothetical protein